MGRRTAVEVVDLVKRYPKAKGNAVDGLSFSVAAGEVFGLLGPNGAGKTTTVGVLTTRVVPTSGSARVAGLDVRADAVAVCAKLAVVPQRQNLDRSLGVRDNLIFHAAYHGVGRVERNRRADELLERMGLTDKAKAIADDLSGGQAQRVMIARGLMHRPEVLFLDEPSTGLDPQARLFVHDQIGGLRAEGVTVVLTTHDMDEAHKLSDRIGIVDHGRLLALDTPDALVRSLPGARRWRSSPTTAPVRRRRCGRRWPGWAVLPAPRPRRAAVRGRAAPRRRSGCRSPGSRRRCSHRPSTCSAGTVPRSATSAWGRRRWRTCSST